VIFAEPTLTPVILPVLLTAATFFALVDQVTVAFLGAFLTERVVVFPRATVAVVLFSVGFVAALVLFTGTKVMSITNVRT
jgi:hypothetical protein